MKTFEEKWTAWIDDQLTGRELEEFEASLPDKAAAQAEKQSAKQLGSLLREQMAPALSNAEFFSHQLRERLDREDRQSTARPSSTAWWTIRRLLWSGATALAIFMRVDPAVSPNATITMFEKKDEHVTVLWVDGLQSLPPEYAAK